MSDRPKRLTGLVLGSVRHVNYPNVGDEHDPKDCPGGGPWPCNGGHPEPLTEVPPWPDGVILEAMHQDCLVLLNSDDPDERLDSLGRLIPYVARGGDLAYLLGMVEP